MKNTHDTQEAEKKATPKAKSRQMILNEITRAELELLGVRGGLNPKPDEFPTSV